MAAWKSHRYLGGAETVNQLDEADVWSTDNTAILPEARKQVHYNPRPARKPLRRRADVDHLAAGPRSLPVNIPEWSKILSGEYKGRAGECEEEEGGVGNDIIPPHEYLARTRGSSFSVHEGAGRTLKGRELSRVRNAIWKKIGFED